MLRTCSGSRAAAGWLTSTCRLDEEHAVEALLRQLDFHGQELRIIDAALGRIALERAEVQRLMTIPGVDATVALSMVAAVGDFRRFRRPEQLVSYLGLNPRVKQSGGQAGQSREDHQAGPRARARDARRGRVHRRQDPRARCARSLSASARVAACRSRSSRPPASWCACAGR